MWTTLALITLAINAAIVYITQGRLSDRIKDLTKEVELSNVKRARLENNVRTLKSPPKLQRGDTAYFDYTYEKVKIEDVFIETTQRNGDYFFYSDIIKRDSDPWKHPYEEYRWVVKVENNPVIEGDVFMPPETLITEAEYNELKSKICKQEKE